jgi:hypothetical protein
MRLIACLILLALISVVSAEPYNVTIGLYNISFDLNTPRNYSVEVMPPIQEKNLTAYSVLINVTNVTKAGIYIWDLKTPEDATPTSIKTKYVLSTRNLTPASVELGKVGGKDGVVAYYVDQKNRQAFLGIYYPDSKKVDDSSVYVGSIHVRVFGTMPRNSTEGMAIAKSLINTLNIEKIEVNVDQLKQLMEKTGENLTAYTLSRSTDAKLLYTNASVHKNFTGNATDSGKLDLINQSAWWDTKITDKGSGKILTWEGYYVNDSEYWNEHGAWTKFRINNTSRVFRDYNEFPGQVNLIRFSNMKVVGLESIQGEDFYKLVGSPIEPIFEGMISQQVLAAYLPSPFPMPDQIRDRKLDIDNTSLINSSSVVLTAWISKDKSLLKRLDINSSLTITPKILNISSSDFRIESFINQSTVYNNFDSILKIELPKEAQNKSIPVKDEYLRWAPDEDWRWTVLGSSLTG